LKNRQQAVWYTSCLISVRRAAAERRTIPAFVPWRAVQNENVRNRKEKDMKIVRVLVGSSGVSAQEIVQRAGAVYAGMKGNPHFPNPPVDPETLKAARDALVNALAVQPNGGVVATAEKEKKVEAVVHLLRQLGHYVEEIAKGDLAILLSSGFQVANSSRTPQPASTPKILRVENGNTGQILVTVKPSRGARYYELRHGAIGAGGTLGSWTNLTFTNSKSMPVSGLTPGTNYAFQVRALGPLGPSDWSDSATRICI